MGKTVEPFEDREHLKHVLNVLSEDGLGIHKFIQQGDWYFRRERAEHGIKLSTNVEDGGAYSFDPNRTARVEFRNTVETLISGLNTFSHGPNTDGLIALSRSLEHGNINKAFEQWEPVVLELRKWHSKLEGAFRNKLRTMDLTPQVKPTTAKRGSVVSLPAGTTWGKLRLRFRNGETVGVYADGKHIADFTHAELGMATSIGARPTKQWELLKEFADAPNNELLKGQYAERSKLAHRVRHLRNNLKSVFPISGDPIPRLDKRGKRNTGWKLALKVEPERGDF